MTENPEATGAMPSVDLTWEDLDTALLVVVVAPDGEVRCWTEEGTATVEHARILRATADRISPVPSHRHQAEALLSLPHLADTPDERSVPYLLTAVGHALLSIGEPEPSA